MRGAALLSTLALTIACGSDDGDGNPEPDAGDGDRQTVFGGDRPVEILVPDNYDHATPTPLMFVLHGLGANGPVQAAYTGFNRLPDSQEVIVVAPTGTEMSDGTPFWNATDACCDFEATGVDDSGYLKGLVDEISAVWNIDPDRVFLFGHSNGGFMSFRLACDHAETFTALASLAGATFLQPADCSPTRAVSVLQIHGDQDDTVLYDGSNFVPGAAATVSTWGAYNECEGDLEASSDRVDIVANLAGDDTRVDRVAGCPPSGEVELWTIEMGSHVPSLGGDFHQIVYSWLESQARNQ